MKTPVLRSLPAAVALALSCGLGMAQTGTSPATTPSTGSSATGGGAAPAAQPGTGTRNTPKKEERLARGDRKFIQDAAEGGMFEVEAGQLAAAKSSDDQVKSFANTLVEQHKAANTELTQLANSKGVELPAAPSHGERRKVEKLGKLSGSKFDNEFVKTAIKDHEKDIKKFQKASGKVKDPDLKAWIDKTLPTLREHLAKAEALPEAGKKSSAAMGNRGASKSGG